MNDPGQRARSIRSSRGFPPRGSATLRLGWARSGSHVRLVLHLPRRSGELAMTEPTSRGRAAGQRLVGAALLELLAAATRAGVVPPNLGRAPW